MLCAASGPCRIMLETIDCKLGAGLLKKSGSFLRGIFMRELLVNQWRESAKAINQMIESESVVQSVEKAIKMMVESYKKGGFLAIAGNGGSAADAQHLATELVVRLCRDRSPIKALALTVDTSALTAAGNDYSFDEIFARQVRAILSEKDILLAITTSGNSPNILRALAACRELGAKSILLSGRTGGKALALADLAILVPADKNNIQEGHEVIYHSIAYALEEELAKIGLVTFK